MTAAPLRRLAHAAVTAVAPELGGAWATDAFSTTRPYGGRPADLLPLGARPFAVPGSADLRRGYLWGEPGRPVALLVHGWGSDSSSMHPFVPALRERGFAVAAFDAPAHGANPGDQATMTQYTAAVAAVLRALGGATVVVAHSLGAIAAVSGAAVAGTSPSATVMLAPTCTLSGVLERWAPADLRATRAVRDLVYRELHRRNGVPVSHWDVRARAAGLNVPVLALHDPEDPVVPYPDAEAIAAALPRVRLVPVPGLGHYGVLTAPAVRDAAAAFAAEHAPGAVPAARGSAAAGSAAAGSAAAGSAAATPALWEDRR